MIIHAMSEKETPVILNVDDDKTDRYATSRILSSAGFRVSEAATGYEAITLIKDLPDLVVLDVNLPDITGFEVCKRIKENASTQHIPVLYLSATFVDTKAKVEGLNVGGDGYLVQPVEPSLLIATIHSLLRIKRSEDALKRTLEEKDRYIIELKQLMAFSDQMSVDTQEADFIKHTGMVLKKQFSIDYGEIHTPVGYTCAVWGRGVCHYHANDRSGICPSEGRTDTQACGICRF